ncbi:glycosyltransferase family 2 protein [Nocardia sp. NPDC051463]|uniref:glycosyltransferase n=1 Tax=Nocardia sp. NPDC051463 TaxID=3154845 RepID=UPI0034253BCA
MKKDIVIGAVTGYDWADIEPWATSLVTSGFAGLGVVIVYDGGRRGDIVAANLESLGLYPVRMPLRGSIYSQRFGDIAHVLRTFAHSLRFAVVVDVRDVCFQADPVKWLETHLERPFLAASESLRYSDESRSWDDLQQSFPAHAERLWAKTICDVGVLAGQAGFMADLCLALSLIVASAGVPAADQSGYNLLLDMEPYRSTAQIVGSENGFTCSAGSAADPGKIETVRPFHLGSEPMLTAEGIQTAAGELYPIVHRYDRVPAWDQALRSRLESVSVREALAAVENAQRERFAAQPGLARVLGDADGASIQHTARMVGVPRESSSIQLYSPMPGHSSPEDGPPPPRVSVVCPTYQRPEFLRKVVRHYCAQTFDGGMEMIIVDDSPEPVDFLDEELCREHRIRYYHIPNSRITIGDKINLMTQLAHGEIIVDFDDDDYYTPQYIERMVEFLGDADFVTLSRWFAYDPASKMFCYWTTDSLSPIHFVLSPTQPSFPISTSSWNSELIHEQLWGYGFSFVWRKSTHQQIEVRGHPPGDLHWDYDFSLRLQRAGYKAICVPDTEGLVLHILHPKSTVSMFPQYVMPEFLIDKYFPLYAEEEV